MELSMKKNIIAIFCILLFLASSALAANPARYTAMGGAFTAIGDDANTIKANPAGLAYIYKSTLSFDTTIDFHPTFSMFDYEPPALSSLGGIYPYDLYYEYESNSIYTIDWTSSSSDKIYDFTDEEGNTISYDDALEAMGFTIDENVLYEIYDWYDGVTFLDLLNQGFNTIGMIPSVSYIDNGYGLSVTQEIAVKGLPGDPADKIHLINSQEYAAGIGNTFGPFALGINAVYTRTSTIAMSTPTFEEYGTYCDSLLSSFGVSDPDELGIEMLNGDLFREYGDTANSLTVGLGAMMDTGSFTIGAYIDDLTDVFADDNGDLQLFSDTTLQNSWETLNIGVAYESNKRKKDYSEDFINLLLAADIHNIGDIDNRSLHMGAEFGLSLGEIITADLRAGYTQDLTVSFDEIMDQGIFDIDKGVFSFGMGAKALITQLDLAVTIPAAFIETAFYHMASDEEVPYETLIGDLNPTDGPQFMLTGSITF